MCCLLALHWFNPILWYAYYRMRADQEIACDALVLSRIRPGESGAYGHAMIKLLEDVSELSRQPFTASFSGSKKQLQRRIAMIAKYRPQTFRWSAAGLLLFLLLGCAALTHSAPEERAIVRFKDGSAQLYKNDPIVFAHDLSDEQDFKIMLSWWLTYVEAQKAGVEPTIRKSTDMSNRRRSSTQPIRKRKNIIRTGWIDTVYRRTTIGSMCEPTTH